MEALTIYLQEQVAGIIQKVTISNPKGDLPYKRITINQKETGYQVEKQTQKQVFHENIAEKQILDYCVNQVEQGYQQLNIWDEAYEHQLRITKKGKLLTQKKKQNSKLKQEKSHNRKKQYLLEEGQIIPPLVDMGVFTKEGKVVASMYDKYKQINKFIEIIDQAVKKEKLEKIHLIDFGCGKSYLTFVVYYYFKRIKNMDIEMIGLDLKKDVIDKCNQTAKKYGYEHLQFEVGDINGYQTKMPVDMVISLHACDTATDYALYNAISWGAKMIISVPCCQHELCAQLDTTQLDIVKRYGIIKERVAALYTDAIRGNLLEACGYKTQILEFVDLSHTPKNLLIRANKSNINKKHKQKMLDEVYALTKEFHLQPTLLNLLTKDGYFDEYRK